MHEPITGIVVATHGAMAFFGGLVHALNAYRHRQTKGWLDVCILLIIASFSGVIFAILTQYLFPHQMYLSHAAAGCGGVLGIEGLTYVALRVRDFIAPPQK